MAAESISLAFLTTLTWFLFFAGGLAGAARAITKPQIKFEEVKAQLRRARGALC